MKRQFFVLSILLTLILAIAGTVSAEEGYTFSITEADHVEEHAANWYIDLYIPQVSGMADKSSEDSLNAYFLERRDAIKAEYTSDIEQLENVFSMADMPHFGYEYNWETIVDSDDYFVFKTWSYYAAGSSMTVNEYRTLDKHSGKLVELTGLADQDRLEKIRSMILDSMKQENETQEIYWVDEDNFDMAFSFIEEYHHWYINENGNLVITFDKYEIAPGAYGECCFEISEDKAAPVREEKYSFGLYTADTIEDSSDNWYLKLRVPAVEGLADKEKEDELNNHFADVADSVKKDYETAVATAEESMTEGDGPHFGYEYFYDILTDTKDYFSFKTVTFFAAGSSMTSSEFWTLDKNTGKLLEWKDIAAEYDLQLIHDQILEEMTKANESGNGLYYTDDEALHFALNNIENSHHWYLNEDGDLVITFDKYEIAVGAQGTPEFVISR